MDFTDLFLTELYTDQPSYSPGDVVKVYSSIDFLLSYSDELEITDCSGKVIDSFNALINRQQSFSANILSDGLNYKEYSQYKIPESMPSGIYLMNKKYPLIVKSKYKNKITVVYPFINNVLYHSVGNKTVFSENYRYASLLRTTPIDKYTDGLKNLYASIDSSLSVNYISDIDLEVSSTFDSSKLLIIYGKSTWWTPKMKVSVENYLKDGGNLLLMSSYVFNNICWYEGMNDRLVMIDSASNKLQSWRNYDSINYTNFVGISYVYGGYSTAKNYKVANHTHPILASVSESEIRFNADLYSSPPIIWQDALPRIDLKSLGFYRGDIIAYNTASYRENDKGIKGIFILQPDSTSGKIVSLGSEDWCIKENFEEKTDLQIITKNAIDYLLK